MLWTIAKWFKVNPPVVFFCAEPMDYFLFLPIQKHLPPIPIVALREARRFLKKRGVKAGRMPAFPSAVIMFRHAHHRFPDERIVKIGLRHGPYHFKAFTHSRAYNAFKVFMMTSKSDVEKARHSGITTGHAIGFPKLDPLFNGSLTPKMTQEIREGIGFSGDKPILLFTTTYQRSGMSACNLWAGRLNELTGDYQILVSVHPWMRHAYNKKNEKQKGIHFIEDYDLLPYLSLADVLISDISSVIAEFCALDKPIITFRVEQGRRILSEIREIIADISVQVADFDELKTVLPKVLQYPAEKSQQRGRANQIFFDQMDGQAGSRAAELIRRLIPAISPSD